MTLVAAVMAVVPASANADPQALGLSEDGAYCAMLVGKAPEGGVSPVRAQACSDVSIEEAKTRLVARYATVAGVGAPVAAAVETRIMVWYENIGYNSEAHGGYPGRMTYIYGDKGGCDNSGYRVKPNSWWQQNMSSIIGDNDCTVAKIHNRALNSASEFRIKDIPDEGRWLGEYSDNVGLTQPFHRR
ncbi:hypothetical protein [Crossiella sp. CA198]|uniref:hypothetical protein n=1 Tax=Crossiella sp. CA198 TaxID=3455607 RepID=UPI003F8D6E62